MSYSRKDVDFAEQLVLGLETLHYTVIIDRKGIHGAEKWEARLSQMILEADAVVFVLSPASAVSDVCHWEVERALELRKRIVPVLAVPLDGVQPHAALSDLNYIFFYAEPSSPGTGWGSGLARLNAALCIEIEWIREHTRVLEMAARWEAEGHPDDLLARGTELVGLQTWRDSRPADAPDLTLHQRTFLQASELAEAQRADATRRQLEEMRAAQEARAAALEASSRAQDERARALRTIARRTVAGIVITALLSVAVGGAAYVAYSNGERARVALLQIQDEQLLQDRLIALARNRDYPQPPYGVDTLARRFEGERADHVGTDHIGGAYYGIYRIQARAQMDGFLAFLHRYNTPFHANLAAAGGTSAAEKRDARFVDAWRALANNTDSAAEFAEMQRDFVVQSSYSPIVSRFAASGPLHLELGKRSMALRAVVFAIGVQYGPNTRLFKDALTGLGNLSRRTDTEIINQLFLFRDKVEIYFPEIQTKSENFAELVRERNHWEQRDALYMLSQENR